MWEQNLTNFIKKRESINIFLHLIDSRHYNLEIDKQVQEFIGSILRPNQHYVQVYTKIDKLTQKELYVIKDNLCVSTTKNIGMNQLVETIISITDIYRNSNELSSSQLD
jgi:GTP-binding protein